MRIGIVAERIWEKLALRSSRFPYPMFDVMGTMMLSRTVMAGVYFGIFDRLDERGKTAVELAEETGCDPHGMELLLRALCSCRYLVESDGCYRNAPGAQRWLLSDRNPTAVNFVRYNYDQWEWVSHLEEFVQTGKARDIHKTLEIPDGWQRYLLGLRDLARLSATEVVDQVRDLRSPRSLLDVGGGHCHHSIILCRRYPSLQVTVVDLEPAVRIGRQEVEQAGFSERFAFITGPLPEVPFGDGHDVAFYLNVAHHLHEDTNRRALHRIFASLREGGRLILLDVFSDGKSRRGGDQFASLLALFFGLTSRQKTYGIREVTGWLRAAGFGKVKRARLRSAPLAGLLIAQK